MKVAFDTGSLLSDDKTRGIGTNTGELGKALVALKKKSFVFDAFSFKDEHKKLESKKYDVVHFTSFRPFFISLPFFKPWAKVILTIHDTIPLIYPDHYPPGLKGKLKLFINKLLIKKNVDGILTISETSKKDICRFFGIRPKKVCVVCLATKAIFKRVPEISLSKETEKKYNLPDKFVLYVGDVNYNKNVLSLAEACVNLGVTLVIAGKAAADENPKPHKENENFIKLLEKYKNNPLVQRVGYVSDSELCVFYNLARVYCQPSYYEGFGFNSLEAQVVGTPVLASKINVHKEVLGESCLYFDPKKGEDLEVKLKKLLGDEKLRQSFVKEGRKNIARYSWKKTAEEVYKLYEEVFK